MVRKYSWECKPRTKAKLEILNRYLGAWFSILANSGFRHVFYIDGFCGPGEYDGGEEGSPTIAARLANRTAKTYPNFTATLIFSDESPKALKHLQTLKEIKNPHSRIKIDIRKGKFSDEVQNILETLYQNPNSPTFSFIDPFGFSHSPLEKIKLFMHNKSSEIIVNFWCGYMNRFKEKSEKNIIEKIKNMVGEDDLSSIIDAEDSIAAFCDNFDNKLKKIGKFTLKFIMRDETNVRDNALFFCSNSSKGFEKIKEAMWKVDPEFGNSFSVHQDSFEKVQTSLFDKEAQTYPLFEKILEQFRGKQDISVEDIFKWVIEETSFLKPHARTELENLYKKNLITITDPESRPRRSNAWPERLLLTFAGKTL